MLQYSTLKSTVVQYNSGHIGAGTQWTGKSSYWLEEVGNGRAERSSTIDGGQVTVLLMPGVDGTHFSIFNSLQLERSYVKDLHLLSATVCQVLKGIILVCYLMYFSQNLTGWNSISLIFKQLIISLDLTMNNLLRIM